MQDPAPSMQRCFSTSATQENEEVMRGPLRSVLLEGRTTGGEHVATENASTSLRMKNRGKVPPRLETLYRLNCIVEMD